MPINVRVPSILIRCVAAGMKASWVMSEEERMTRATTLSARGNDANNRLTTVHELSFKFKMHQWTVQSVLSTDFGLLFLFPTACFHHSVKAVILDHWGNKLLNFPPINNWVGSTSWIFQCPIIATAKGRSASSHRNQQYSRRVRSTRSIGEQGTLKT